MIKTAIVLCAGKGTKVWPFGETRPKAILPIANVPLVRRIIDGLSTAGVKRTIVVVGHREGQVRQTLSEPTGVEFVSAPDAPGTAQAVKAALGLIDEDAFLVVYGDIVTADANYRRVCEALGGSDAAVAALVTPLGSEQPQDWLCARVSEGHVTQILGHPRGGVTHRLCGVYAMTRQVIPYVERNPGVMTSIPLGVMPPDEAELAQSVQDAVDGGLKILAVEAQGYFVDVDKPWHIVQANNAVMSEMFGKLQGNQIAPSAEISPQARVEGNVVLGDNSRIGPNVLVRGNLWVGKDTVIDNGAIVKGNTLIGDNCRVEHYCTTSGVLGHQTRIGHCSEVSGIVFGNFNTHSLQFSGVVGYGTDLGAGTNCGTLRFDDRTWGVQTVKGRKEFLQTAANTIYIGDYCRTGVNCTIMPGCKVGPGSVIGSGVVLNEDVPSRTLVYLEQQLVRKEWRGPEVYGW